MEEATLELCRKCIEERLPCGSSENWTTRDFDELSLRIQEKTGRTISATTLKRLWGRAAYANRPSRYTLDTLAEFLNYESWHAFATETGHIAPHSERRRRNPTPRFPRGRLPATIRLLILTIIVLLGIASIALFRSSTAPDSASSIVQFTSSQLARGLPNTVVFKYDVSGVDADSFFIQQSWDRARAVAVSPDGHTATFIYYYPGYFNAKLVADHTLLRETPVHVTTDGWLALLERDPIPIYLQSAVDTSGGFMAVSKDRIPVDDQSGHRLLDFYYVQDFGPVSTTNFKLETALRSIADAARYPCRRAEVLVGGERGVLLVPVAMSGCVSALDVRLGDVILKGATNDLSALGADLSDWQQVRLDVTDGNVTIQVGENPPLSAQFHQDAGRIVGLRLQFEEAGEVDFVVLSDSDGGIVYNESF